MFSEQQNNLYFKGIKVFDAIWFAEAEVTFWDLIGFIWTSESPHDESREAQSSERFKEIIDQDGQSDVDIVLFDTGRDELNVTLACNFLNAGFRKVGLSKGDSYSIVTVAFGDDGKMISLKRIGEIASSCVNIL